MNKKALIPLAVAIVLGLGAAIIARGMFSKKSPVVEIPLVSAPVEKVTLVVAKSTLPPGKMIMPDDLTVGDVQAKETPAGAFTDANLLPGRVLRTALFRGQPVMETHLAPVGAGSGLQALIPTGMRAVTIDINEVTGVSGMLTPGCRVDVLSTLNDENKNPQRSKVILENIKVQAVGTNVSDVPAPTPAPGEERQNAPMARTVTLLATPDQAATIELAGTIGRLRLVLRAAGDESPALTSGVTLASLQTAGLASAGESEREKASLRKIEQSTTRPTMTKRIVTIIRGGVETNVVVEEPVRPESGHHEAPIMTGTDTSPF